MPKVAVKKATNAWESKKNFLQRIQQQQLQQQQKLAEPVDKNLKLRHFNNLHFLTKGTAY